MSPQDPFAHLGGVPRPPAFLDQLVDWVRAEGAWWASSFVFHMLLMCALMLLGSTVSRGVEGDAPSLEQSQMTMPKAPSQLERFESLETEAPGLDPANLDPASLAIDAPPGPTIEETQEKYYDDNPVFTEQGGGRPMPAAGPSLGGMGGFDIVGIGSGPAVRGPGGVGSGVGTGTNPGSGGSGVGFGGRGTGMKKAMVGGYGGTKRGEQAVAAALDWLARHQFEDGHWSLDYTPRCRDRSCTGHGSYQYTDTAATAFGLLPFLGAGQTHEAKGPYREVIRRGLMALTKNQQANGDLSPGESQYKMYVHGLAALTLSEIYGMTKDAALGRRAQLALDFIQSAQNNQGGWRYQPGMAGDMSVTGWQVMALKSGQMGGLSVRQSTLEGARAFLKATSGGNYGGLYRYVPDRDPTKIMTSVGLLCSQYLGAQRGDPGLAEGVAYLMANPPEHQTRNLYYWYYATQVLHNVPGPEWDIWNRKMRRALIEHQTREGCARGSWDPMNPLEQFTSQAGRVMVTSLATLTLEVYYRYLPLYKLDSDAAPGAVPVVQPGIAPPAKLLEREMRPPGAPPTPPPGWRPGTPPGPAPGMAPPGPAPGSAPRAGSLPGVGGAR